MSNLSKKSLPIQDLEIKISSDSSFPHVILNGIDFRAEGIGLKSIKIIWGTKGGGIPESLIQIDYIDAREHLHEATVKQSFQNTLLK